MKSRTCPHCNYKYSISEYSQGMLFRLVISEFECKNCNKRITFDFHRRFFVALAFGALYIFLLSIQNFIWMLL